MSLLHAAGVALWQELSIPAEQIALAIALSMIYDYLATAGNMTGIPMLLGILAKEEGLLDEMNCWIAKDKAFWL